MKKTNFTQNIYFKCLGVVCLLMISVSSIAQVQQAWLSRINGVENKDERGRFIALDASGYLYVAGSRHGTADDANSGFLTLKYNPLTGQTIWGQINDGAGSGNAAPSAMAVDAAGNVYVTGSSGASSEGQKYFTIKYNTNGSQQWEQSYTNSRAGEHALAIAVDANGSVFVTGISYDDNGTQSIGTIKYDAGGSRKWVRHYNGDNDEGAAYGTCIAVDASGNVYVAGIASYAGTGEDVVILKYDNNGNQLSSNRYDGPAKDAPEAMVLDAAANIYVTGFSTNGLHGLDCITLKFNSNCNFVWEHLHNGLGDKNDLGRDIAVDGFGNVFVAGGSVADNSAELDGDYLTIKYDANGTKLWDVAYNGPENVGEIAQGIALDGSGNVYVTGYSGTGNAFTSPVNAVTIKYDGNGVQQWTQVFDGPDGYRDEGSDIVSDANGNVYITGESYSGTTKMDLITIKYSQCGIICPADIVINNDPGQCGAVVEYEVATTGDCGSSFRYSRGSGLLFPVGATVVTATSTETGANCSFNVTVNDIEIPVISCQPSLTVSLPPGVCSASIFIAPATATDNCNVTVVGTRSDGLLLTDNFPAGITTITWTATDEGNNIARCSQTIRVEDNEPPVITNVSPSLAMLAPPNHTMVDVTISYSSTDNCSVPTCALTVSSNELVNGVGDGDTDPDWEIIDDHHIRLRAERSSVGDGRVYTIKITCTDSYGNSTSTSTEVKVAHNITAPQTGHPFRIGSTVPLSGVFWDKNGNTHTGKWSIDNTIINGVITEPSGNQNGKLDGSYRFNTAGVYKLRMNITDQNNVTSYATTNGDLEAIIVIYDPNGGHTYGGGYFNSPAGALTADPSAIGKASYGFAMNYFKNSTYPKGETQFEFKVGDFEFNALNFDYLVISNSMAQFKGTGKIIGGQSGIGFIMTVADGQLDGSGADKIRMKIYNKSNGKIFYDNQPGASDAALPIQPVGANSVIVISGTNSILTSSNTSQKAEMEASAEKAPTGLDLIVYPNPSANNFIMNVNARTNERITMQVIDIYGRVIETRNVSANSTVRFGDRYNVGTYFVRIMQGKNHKEIKLIKLSD